MKTIIVMRTAALALTSFAAVQSAIAHTQEWYADHLAEARATQSRCLASLKADGKLTQDEENECHGASDAVVRSGKFVPSAPKSY